MAYQSSQCNVIFKVHDINGEGLIGAYVEVVGLELKAITDINGEATFKLDQGESYSVMISFLGFETINQAIMVPYTREHRQKIRLKESSTELGEVVVQGQSVEKEVLRQPHKAEFISLDNIRSQPVEVVNIINQMPGMRIRQNGGLGSRIDISINGIGGKGVKVFVDEIPVYLLGTGYDINNISQGIIDNIEIYKGTIPVKFGSDALGGVINIQTRKKGVDYLDVSYSFGSWNTHQTSLSANKKFGKSKRWFIGVEGFQNYSDNNYWMDNVRIIDEELSRPGLPITKRGRARRFNDIFDSKLGRLVLGVRDLAWADEIQLFSSLSDVYKEWQHGFVADEVWGEPFSEEDSWSTAFTLKKFSKDDQWDINVSAGYISNKQLFVDTARRTYFWDGSFIPKIALAGESVSFNNGTTPETTTQTYFFRQSTNYAIHPKHYLNITTLLSKDAFSATDRAFTADSGEELGDPQDLLKNYAGLSLESKLWNERLTNIASIKHFYQKSKAVANEFTRAGSLSDNTFSLVGYGNVLRFQLNPNFVINVGYEFTIRLADGNELFGDYITTISNPDLKPEESQNINLGANWASGNNKLRIGASYFYRNSSNKIAPVGVGNRANIQNRNLSQVETNGVEINAQYQATQHLSFSANSTYQYAIAKDLDLSEGFSASSIGERIPNEPYFFSNFIANYTIPKLSVIPGELKLRYSLNNVYSFLATWDQGATGASSTPTQTIHNLSLVWAAPKERWSFGLEGRNVFNTQAFDNFNVQKPGRGFYVKARLFLEN
ncbi:MAG: TonB-dependent receptor [Bacteroidota bacterium]